MGEDERIRERAVLATGVSFTLSDAQAPDQPLIWVNPAFTTMTGYSPSEVVGRNCRFLQGPDSDPLVIAALRQATRDGQDVKVTLLNHRKDGTAFWNEVAISPVRNASGVVTHLVGVQTDVTERVEAEQGRVAALGAERAARADAEQARADAEQARADAEQARLEAERARLRAEAVSQRLAVVAEATGLLAATLDVDESLDRLTRLVVPRLADWVVLNLVDDHGRLTRPAIVRHRDGHENLLEKYAALVPSGLAPGSPLHDLLDGAPPSVHRHFTQPDRDTQSPAEQQIRDLTLTLGAASVMFVPLVARRRVLGTMMLVHGPSHRLFDDEDLALTADLGRRAGLAIDNARLYTQEHRIALTLQRSMLPVLPTLPGLALAAQYLPAGQNSQVGGDWWDVFALPDGATGLAIGDVMGHDVAAAAAMGQLRSVLRTCAWAGDRPSTVLDRMDQLVESFEMAQLATCIYARLQPHDGAAGRRRTPRLLWANAGHLPPVLLSRTGDARLLTDGLHVPLGVPDLDPRAQADVSLEPGDTLLLYTDGLVETRTGDIDSDVAGLLESLRQHRSEDGPQALVDRLTLGLSELTDDVAILAVQHI
ncbi:MAG: SpoIIE family protein phosphatase [Mycobacteriales bacterium]